MAKRDQIKKFYEKYYKQFQKLIESDEDMLKVFDFFRRSKDTQIAQMARMECKKYDEKWIRAIEEGIDDINYIVYNPKRFIKNERIITPVELAKKTTAESVIHLASHTQFVKDIDERGNVIPSKILTIQAEDDIAIYENKFVKSLIDKLLIFIEKRYNYIQEHMDTKDTDVLKISSNVKVDSVEYTYETKIKIKVPSQEEMEANKGILERIVFLRKMIMSFTHTPFYLQLKDVKIMHSPISVTNMIAKNPHYRSCYKMWKFLESYEEFGVKVKIKEQSSPIDDEYLNQIFSMMFVSALTLETNKTSLISPSEAKLRLKTIDPMLKYKVSDPEFKDDKYYILTPEMQKKLELKEKEKEKQRQEKEKLKAQALKEKEKQKEAERKAKEKEKLRLKRLKELETEKKKKQEALLKEKQRKEAIKLAELERRRRIKDEELERIKKARIKVKSIAKEDKEKGV